MILKDDTIQVHLVSNKPQINLDDKKGDISPFFKNNKLSIGSERRKVLFINLVSQRLIRD